MASNPQRPFLLDEIAQRISSFAGYREQRDLAYTCKQLFSSIAPVIWKEVPHVKIIAKLIPGVRIIEESYAPEDRFYQLDSEIRMMFDECSLTDEWIRFWFYAPFVKRLTLLAPHEDCRIQGWRFLFTKLNGSPLLPNLCDLAINGAFYSSYIDRLAWFALCLTPSLERLQLVDILWGSDKDNILARPSSFSWAYLENLSTPVYHEFQ
ncbi:hypothetical protein B0J17DRAFT_715256 [Rhizoctonia solani]|nr:hypothetical protein B0J17DRAFT_715256 [Rhizoctonia solani]